MESKEEISAHLRVAERAAAAPYVDYPKDPWWSVPAIGLLAVLFVLGTHVQLRTDLPSLVGVLLNLSVGGSGIAYYWWQRRRRGTMPQGDAPREVSRVMWAFIVGAVLVCAVLLLLAAVAPLWLALPAAFLLVSASMLWYGRAYEEAAAQVRNRLA
ncbi:hypothetical protein [Polymorphospora rubra]|uniref:Transmembrane protein n=1 Tax=Polymorphospora rubra TaxID=338584 RepID=A0A810N8V8_9ACTN|nr:hypothetical protein [Polymorphospora rubra]BCJ69687.1 hypothetical protein Prubr_67080 [Polymorphospora rubra]